MGGLPETGPADFWPLVDKFSWYRADAALARFRQTSHGHDAVIAILGRNGNQTPQEPGADQSRGTAPLPRRFWHVAGDRKSTRLNSSHSQISYAVFCLKKT